MVKKGPARGWQRDRRLSKVKVVFDTELAKHSALVDTIRLLKMVALVYSAWCPRRRLSSPDECVATIAISSFTVALRLDCHASEAVLGAVPR